MIDNQVSKIDMHQHSCNDQRIALKPCMQLSKAKQQTISCRRMIPFPQHGLIKMLDFHNITSKRPNINVTIVRLDIKKAARDIGSSRLSTEAGKRHFSFTLVPLTSQP